MALIRCGLHAITKTSRPCLVSLGPGLCSRATQETTSFRQCSLPGKFLSCRAFSANAFGEFVSSTAAVRSCEKLLFFVHELSGTEWWATIIITVIAARTLITLPFAVLQRRIAERLRVLKPQMDVIAKSLMDEIRTAQLVMGKTEQSSRSTFQREIRQRRKDFYVKHNVHPAKLFLLPLLQIPLWISLSFALRNLSAGAAEKKAIQTVTELQREGILWFPDLTQPDRTWIIPFLNAFFAITLTELHFAASNGSTRLFRIAKTFARLTSFLIIPVTALMPTAVSSYWAVSSLFGLFQYFLFSNRIVQQALGLGASVRSKTPVGQWLSNLFPRGTKRP